MNEFEIKFYHAGIQDAREAGHIVLPARSKRYEQLSRDLNVQIGDPRGNSTIAYNAGVSKEINRQFRDSVQNKSFLRQPDEIDPVLRFLDKIAQDNIPALKERGDLNSRNNDTEDFFETSVWTLRDVLMAAYNAGRESVLSKDMNKDISEKTEAYVSDSGVKIFRLDTREGSIYSDHIKYWSDSLGNLMSPSRNPISEKELPASLKRAFYDLFFVNAELAHHYLVETPRGYGVALCKVYDDDFAEENDLPDEEIFQCALADAKAIAGHPDFEDAEICLGEHHLFCYLTVVLPSEISVDNFKKATETLDALVYRSITSYREPPLTSKIESAVQRTIDSSLLQRKQPEQDYEI